MSEITGIASTVANTTAGALVSLAALGAQDVFLTCNPKCTLFHQSYCRITNFSIGEYTMCLENAPSGQNFAAKTCVKAEIKRAGDLLGPVFFDASLAGLPVPVLAMPPTNPATDARVLQLLAWTPAIGYALIKDLRVNIGSQEFETQQGEYMMMHDEISREEGKRASALIGDYACSSNLIGCALVNTVFDGLSALGSDESIWQAAVDYSTRSQKILAPLPLFWTKHAGNYLNVVGSQYHNIVIEFDTRSSQSLITSNILDRSTGQIFAPLTAQKALNPKGAFGTTVNILDNAGTNNGILSGASLLAIFVQLDAAERRLKAQAAQTMRMVYVQGTTYYTAPDQGGRVFQTSNYFNHPVQRFVWAFRPTGHLNNGEFFNFGAYRGGSFATTVDLLGPLTDPRYTPVTDMVPSFTDFQMLINNHTRTHQSAEYYLYVQPYQFAKRVPTRFVYSYSFAMYPDCDDVYSGSINLSRIDNVVLRWSFKALQVQTGTETNPTTNLILQNSVGGRRHTQINGTITDASSGNFLEGSILFYAETINFYKQAAGMIGLLFAN